MTPATPLADRFGGWFVTGARLPREHRGNEVSALEGHSHALASTAGLYPAEGYLSAASDVAALMVLIHQVQTVNIMIRANWEARTREWGVPAGKSPGSESRDRAVLRTAASDLVDTVLFIDETPLETPLRGTSGFTERFAMEGRHDRNGRSLRELDLSRRLMRYPCSYLIYSPLFDALHLSMKQLVYERLWQILSGAEHGPRYRRALTLDDRRAIVEILRATKPGLPSYFAGHVK
jgi:hypothetical protein